MKKATIETFIKRYSLDGIVSKVKIKYDPTAKTLHTRAAIDNRTFMADVILNNFSDLGDKNELVLCIGDTDKLKLMLRPYGDDINVAVNKSGDRLLGITFSDADCESYCTLADPSAIDPVPKNLQDLPDYQVEVSLTEEFVDKFRMAHMALKDVEQFTVAMNKAGNFEVVLGYSTSNSNRIRITPTTSPDKKKIDTALSFPIQNVIEVLKVNSDIPNGTMCVNNQGIIRLYFKNSDYTCTYYQFCNKKQ